MAPGRCRDVLVERGDVELGGRAEERDPGVVDQNVDVADVSCQALNIGRVTEVGSDEAGLAAGVGDLLHGLGYAGGVAAVTATCPSPASCSATARPMPEVAPVASGVALRGCIG